MTVQLPRESSQASCKSDEGNLASWLVTEGKGLLLDRLPRIMADSSASVRGSAIVGVFPRSEQMLG